MIKGEPGDIVRIKMSVWEIYGKLSHQFLLKNKVGIIIDENNYSAALGTMFRVYINEKYPYELFHVDELTKAPRLIWKINENINDECDLIDDIIR